MLVLTPESTTVISGAHFNKLIDTQLKVDLLVE